MELINNDSRLLLLATSHRNIMIISNTLVYAMHIRQIEAIFLIELQNDEKNKMF